MKVCKKDSQDCSKNYNHKKCCNHHLRLFLLKIGFSDFLLILQ